MTLNDLITSAGAHPQILLAIFVAPPLLALGTTLLHRRGKAAEPPWSYIYATLVYAACLPGLLAASLTAYAQFFTRQNLLDVNLLVYLAPIMSMALTLLAIKRVVAFDRLPGFGRLSGLMLLMVLTFVVLFMLSRTRIWLLFGGSFVWLIGLGFVIFVGLKVAAKKALGHDDDPS